MRPRITRSSAQSRRKSWPLTRRRRRLRRPLLRGPAEECCGDSRAAAGCGAGLAEGGDLDADIRIGTGPRLSLSRLDSSLNNVRLAFRTGGPSAQSDPARVRSGRHAVGQARLDQRGTGITGRHWTVHGRSGDRCLGRFFGRLCTLDVARQHAGEQFVVVASGLEHDRPAACTGHRGEPEVPEVRG